jgi:hypothetical protein
MSDFILALIGLVIFIAFAAGLALSVGQMPLIVVTAAVILMAAYDFWRDASGRRR